MFSLHLELSAMSAFACKLPPPTWSAHNYHASQNVYLRPFTWSIQVILRKKILYAKRQWIEPSLVSRKNIKKHLHDAPSSRDVGSSWKLLRLGKKESRQANVPRNNNKKQRLNNAVRRRNFERRSWHDFRERRKISSWKRPRSLPMNCLPKALSSTKRCAVI